MLDTRYSILNVISDGDLKYIYVKAIIFNKVRTDFITIKIMVFIAGYLKR